MYPPTSIKYGAMVEENIHASGTISSFCLSINNVEISRITRRTIEKPYLRVRKIIPMLKTKKQSEYRRSRHTERSESLVNVHIFRNKLEFLLLSQQRRFIGE